MPRRIPLTTAFLCLCITVAGGAQDDRQIAAALWEQAVAAKGGRERLAAIHSFAILEKTAFTPPSLPEMAAGRAWQMVCALPDAWWDFLDYRPGQMGVAVRAANARTGLGWSTFDGYPAKPFLRPNTDLKYVMRRLQYIYFLETSAVRPTPLRASRVKLGSKTADRVETQVDDEFVVFDLDVDTHLPTRIETSRKNTLKPPRPGMTPPGDIKRVYELGDYHEIAGLRVPRRVMFGRDPAEVRVEINPDYEPSIFTTPPSPDATIEAWRKTRGPGFGIRDPKNIQISAARLGFE
jgi:hypothetical protein